MKTKLLMRLSSRFGRLRLDVMPHVSTEDVASLEPLDHLVDGKRGLARAGLRSSLLAVTSVRERGLCARMKHPLLGYNFALRIAGTQGKGWQLKLHIKEGGGNPTNKARRFEQGDIPCWPFRRLQLGTSWPFLTSS